MRTALVEELKILKVPLEEEIPKIERKIKEGGEGGGAIVPTDPGSDVYSAYVPKIGLLRSEEVEKVMLAYLTIRQFRKNLILLTDAKILDEHRVDVPRNSFAPFVNIL